MTFAKMPDCPICRSGNVRYLFRADNLAYDRFLDLSRKKYRGAMNAWVEGISLDVLSCNICQHIWHAEFPCLEELSVMYTSSKAIDSSKRLTEPSYRMLYEMGLLKRMIRQRPDGGKPRLLDYGAGFGMWARAAVSAGFDVVAFEPSLERVDSLGIEFAYRCVNNIEHLEGEKFDAINCEQVLEHVGDPVAVLETFRRLSGLSAAIRIAVPNTSILLRSGEGLQSFPFDGERPHLLSPYEHLHGFTPRSFNWMIRSVGLRKSLSVLRYAPKQWLRMMVPNTFFLGRFAA